MRPIINLSQKLRRIQLDPTVQTIGLLVVAVLILNLDRLVLGELGPLRRLDVADQYVDKFNYCGKFWHSPSEYLWNASILRGWPILLGSVNPQHLGCVLSAVLPITFVLPVLQIIIECLVATGSFLLLYSILGYQHRASLYGALLNLTIYYWYNENPFVTQISLLPALLAFLSVGGLPISWFLRLPALLFIMMLSYPPYVLPLMPLMHICVLWCLCSPQTRRTNLKLAIAFWGIYTFFSAPCILGYLQNWHISNRSLWHKGFVESNSFTDSFFLFATSGCTWFPPLVTLAILSRRSLRKVLYGIGALSGIVIFVAFMQSSAWSQITALIPQTTTFTFFYARLYNIVGFITFLLSSYLVHRELQPPSKNFCMRLTKIVFFSLILGSIMSMGSALKGGTLFIFALFIGLFLISDLFRFAKKPMHMILLILFFLLPFRLQYTVFSETLPYGNLFQDRLEYPNELEPYRIVTLVEDCYPHNFYPAQASMLGMETLDGFSVFYDGRDAQRWFWYITSDSINCSRQFYYWNNRIDLTLDDWNRNPNRVLRWLWINNVAFIRTTRPIEHPALVLIDTAQVKNKWHKLNLGRELEVQNQYLYRINNPITRVFGISDEFTEEIETPASFESEMRVLQKLDSQNCRNIDLDKYNPSYLEFHGSFSESDHILASINYNSDWILRIDDKKRQDRLQEGLFGMISISPLPGFHTYALSFENNSFKYVLFCCIFALVLLTSLVWWISYLSKAEVKSKRQ